MSDKRAIRDLERDLRRQPENLPLRLRLAAAYRIDGRVADAVQLYRSVAVAAPVSAATPRAARVLEQEVAVRDLSPVRRPPPGSGSAPSLPPLVPPAHVPVRPLMIPTAPPLPPPLSRPSTASMTPTPL